MKSNLERHVEQFFAASGADHAITLQLDAQLRNATRSVSVGKRQVVAELAIEALAHATTLLATVAEIATVEQLMQLDGIRLWLELYSVEKGAEQS